MKNINICAYIFIGFFCFITGMTVSDVKSKEAPIQLPVIMGVFMLSIYLLGYFSKNDKE